MERNRTLLAGKVYLIGILIVLLFSVISGVIVFFLARTGMGKELIILSIQIILPLLVIIPTIVAIIKYKLYIDFIGFSGFKIRDLILSVLVLILVYPFLSFITLIVTKILPVNMDHVTILMQDIGKLPISYLPLALLSFAILPAICEEIQFRGLYVGCYKRAGHFKAALITSLMFALAHLNFVQFVYTFFIGIVFYCLRIATGSIYVTIIAHFILNAFAVTTVFVVIPDIKYIDLSGHIIGLVGVLITIVLGLLLAFRLIMLMAKLNNKQEEFDNFFKEGTQKIFSKTLCIAIIIAIIIIVSQFII